MADTAELERDEEIAYPIGSGVAGGIPASWLPGALAPAVSAKAPPVVEEPSPTLDWMTTLSPETAARRQQLQQAKVDSTGSINRLFGARAEEDRVRRLKAYDATNIQPGELQPWDAEAAREKYKFDPLESFGSLGSAFAMIASAFTRAPMTNALNAGAAAMNAIKDGKDQDYERAFKAFKENTDLALKRHQIMQQRYADADKFASTDLTTWRSMITATAAEYDDQQVLTLMQAGLDKPALDAMHSRNTLARDMQALSEADMDHQMKRGVYKQMAASIDEEFSDPMQRSARKLAAMRFVFDKKEPKPEDAAFGQWFLTEGYKAPPDAAIAKAAELKKRHGTGSMDSVSAEAARVIYDEKVKTMPPAQAWSEALREVTRDTSKSAAGKEVANEKRMQLADAGVADFETATGVKASPLIEGIIRKAYMAEGTTSGMRLAQVGHAIDEIQKTPAVERTPEKISEIMNHAFQAKPSITDADAEVEGDLFIRGSPKSIASRTSARNGTDAANIQKSRNSALKTLRELGMNSEEAASFLIAQTADLKASTAAANAIGQRVGGLEVNMELVRSTAHRVKELSAKVPRSEFPNLNAITNAAFKATGDTDIVKFNASLRTFLAEYARATVGGNAQLAVYAQKKTEDQLNETFTHAQTIAAVDQIVNEVELIKQGARNAQKFWRDGIAARGKLSRPDFVPVDDLPGYSIRER